MPSIPGNPGNDFFDGGNPLPLCLKYLLITFSTLDFKKWQKGGSPGLVVMGGYSCSKGQEFESQRHILDGHFSHLFVVRIAMFVWKDKNKQKRGRRWPIFIKKKQIIRTLRGP